MRGAVAVVWPDPSFAGKCRAIRRPGVGRRRATSSARARATRERMVPIGTSRHCAASSYDRPSTWVSTNASRCRGASRREQVGRRRPVRTGPGTAWSTACAAAAGRAAGGGPRCAEVVGAGAPGDAEQPGPRAGAALESRAAPGTPAGTSPGSGRRRGRVDQGGGETPHLGLGGPDEGGGRDRVARRGRPAPTGSASSSVPAMQPSTTIRRRCSARLRRSRAPWRESVRDHCDPGAAMRWHGNSRGAAGRLWVHAMRRRPRGPVGAARRRGCDPALRCGSTPTWPAAPRAGPGWPGPSGSPGSVRLQPVEVPDLTAAHPAAGRTPRASLPGGAAGAGTADRAGSHCAGRWACSRSCS